MSLMDTKKHSALGPGRPLTAHVDVHITQARNHREMTSGYERNYDSEK